MSRLRIDIDRLSYKKVCELYREIEPNNPDEKYLLEKIKYLRANQPKLKEKEIIFENQTIH